MIVTASDHTYPIQRVQHYVVVYQVNRDGCDHLWLDGLNTLAHYAVRFMFCVHITFFALCEALVNGVGCQGVKVWVMWITLPNGLSEVTDRATK